ncbi:MAG: DedA family protein [Acidobacteriaceae bacterium]|nr:DedA family protein [Acidobacteriaceae bacterium]
MQALYSWIAHYGYAALFALLMLGILGLPVPDETLLFFCGYLIWKGRLRLDCTLLTAFAGSACGITASYFLGKKWGRLLLHHYGPRFHITPQRIHRVYYWFHRIGAWVLTAGYFIPGVRHFAALVAGISHLRYPKFALFAYFGAAIWVSTFLTLGYIVGEQWEQTSEMVHRYSLIGCGIALAVATAWWWIRNRQRAETKHR